MTRSVIVINLSHNQSLVVGSIASKYFFSMKQGKSLCLKNVYELLRRKISTSAELVLSKQVLI